MKIVSLLSPKSSIPSALPFTLQRIALSTTLALSDVGFAHSIPPSAFAALRDTFIAAEGLSTVAGTFHEFGSSHDLAWEVRNNVVGARLHGGAHNTGSHAGKEKGEDGLSIHIEWVVEFGSCG